MKIGIATDHNGVDQKQEIILHILKNNIEIIDFSKDNTPIDDYPDFAGRVAKAIQNEEIDLGILMCGTGIGMSIAANKYKKIRCAKVSNESEAELARLHNNANIIALSYKEPIENLIKMIDIFINTNFSNEERHIRRIEKIGKIENEY